MPAYLPFNIGGLSRNFKKKVAEMSFDREITKKSLIETSLSLFSRPSPEFRENSFVRETSVQNGTSL